MKKVPPGAVERAREAEKRSGSCEGRREKKKEKRKNPNSKERKNISLFLSPSLSLFSLAPQKDQTVANHGVGSIQIFRARAPEIAVFLRGFQKNDKAELFFSDEDAPLSFTFGFVSLLSSLLHLPPRTPLCPALSLYSNP